MANTGVAAKSKVASRLLAGNSLKSLGLVYVEDDLM
jgi:hypothetical protein